MSVSMGFALAGVAQHLFYAVADGVMEGVVAWFGGTNPYLNY